MNKHCLDHKISKNDHAALKYMNSGVKSINYDDPNSFFTTFGDVLRETSVNCEVAITKES